MKPGLIWNIKQTHTRTHDTHTHTQTHTRTHPLRDRHTVWSCVISGWLKGSCPSQLNQRVTGSTLGLLLANPFLSPSGLVLSSAHIAVLFSLFGFDPRFLHFRVGFIKCLSLSLTLSLPRSKWKNCHKRKASNVLFRWRRVTPTFGRKGAWR